MSRKLDEEQQNLVDREITGTFDYLAPENFNGINSHKSDMWSVGIIIYTMLSGKKPFRGQQIESKILSNDYDIDFPVSKEAESLIEKLLEPNLSLRLTASQALQHPWLSSI